MKDINEKIKAYALKNALTHKGKSNQGAVISALFNEGLKKQDIKTYIEKITKIIQEVNSLSLEEQKKEFEKLENIVSKREIRQGLPELPDVPKSGVIMRFAPSPSGPLHIGHMISMGPNFLYFKKYGGKFYLRIEDTNPNNIYKPAYKMIETDIRWLLKGEKFPIIIQSNRISLYYKYIKKLLFKNAVYVCDCNKDDFKILKKNKRACPCRELTKNQQLIRWGKMLDKKGYKEGEAVLRFKTTLSHKNPAMRDFPLARINETTHPLQKNKYRVWPLMNLSVTVDDIEMKITHIIRGKDHKDNSEKQKMIYKILGKKYPWCSFMGKLHFKESELSTTKIKEGIEQKKYSGWDDPKLMTLSSLKKQGYNPINLWGFIKSRGLNKIDKTISKKDFSEVINKIFKVK